MIGARARLQSHRVNAEIAGLHGALDRERRAIADRAFDRLPGLAADTAGRLGALETLMTRAPDAARDAEPSLAALRAAAERNRALLEALREGLARARSRVEAVAETARRSGFYTVHGALAPMETRTQTRRA